MITGIDVSDYQGTVDWKQVRAAGYTFAWCKATEGSSFTASTWAHNRDAAKAAGVRVGAYHFCRGGNGEMTHFLSAAHPEAGELLPVLDVEVPGISAAWVLAAAKFLSSQLGVWPVIYGSPGILAPLHLDPSLAHCPLWVAHYTTETRPIIPAPWNSYSAWQYSSTGHVPGISGSVDMDRLAVPLDSVTYKPAPPAAVKHRYYVWLTGAYGRKTVASFARQGDGRGEHLATNPGWIVARANAAGKHQGPEFRLTAPRATPPVVGKRL